MFTISSFNHLMFLFCTIFLLNYILLTIIYQKSYLNLHFILIVLWIIYAIVEVVFNDLIIEYKLLTVFFLYNKEFVIYLLFDKLSIWFISLILLVYIFVITYTQFYLKDDPFIIRFIFYINIFTLSMIFLILSSNFIFIFYNWELIGITSYLLINYWFNRLKANLNSIQAIMYNKLGDIAYLLSLLLLINNLNNNYIYYIFIISIFSKSAQFIFMIWLTNAMEAPTPTSVLLHSCTMVTLGIYLLYRIYDVSLNLEIINIFSLLTILITGLNAYLENDIKKIIAFSTCSQLGYMFYMITNIDLSLFHLLLHGFFKSLLFIISGFIIYIYYNQDMRLVGSLSILNPNIYLLLLISILGQLSIPFISSFYSKDLLLEINYSSYIHYIILLLLGTFLTLSYSIKLLINISYKNFIIPNHNFNYNIKYLYILFIGIIPLGLLLKNMFTLYIINDLLYINILLKVFILLLLLISVLFVINFKLSNNYLYLLIINNFYIEKTFSKVLFRLYNYKSVINFNYLENFVYNNNSIYIIKSYNYFIYIIYPVILLFFLISI